MKHEHRYVGAFVAAIAGLCLAGLARAATVTVNWTPPTTNTDGSAIAGTGAGSLTNYRIEYGTCNGTAFGVKAGEITRAAPASTATLNLQPGTSCVRVFAANTYGSESVASNVATKVVDPPTPNPPQLTTIAAQVYDVLPNERTFAFDRGRLVGTTRLGMACDEERTTGADFYALERPSKAIIVKTPRSAALVARCGSTPARADQGNPTAAPGASAEGDDAFGHGRRVLVGSGLHPTSG